MDGRHPNQDVSSARFLLEVKGEVQAEFSTCRGLGDLEIRKPCSSAMTLDSEAHSKVIELEFGSTDSLFIWEWYSNILGSKPEKLGITVVEQNEKGHEIERWNVTEAWPVNWLGQADSIHTDHISIRTLEICHSGSSQEIH